MPTADWLSFLHPSNTYASLRIGRGDVRADNIQPCRLQDANLAAEAWYPAGIADS